MCRTTERKNVKQKDTEMNSTETTKYPEVKVKLVGENGDAYSILGRVGSALQRAGLTPDEVQEYITEATAGDYDHLLRTTMRWVSCDVDGEEPDDPYGFDIDE